MSRSKVLKFVFQIPITRVKNDDGVHKSVQIATLEVSGQGKIAAELGEHGIPADFADNPKEWVKIIIDDVRLTNELGDGPVKIMSLLCFPACKDLYKAIEAAAVNHCHTIYTSK